MFEDIHFPEAPKIVVEPPGPKAKEIIKLQNEYEGGVVLYPKAVYPLVPESALGATIRDVDGNVYIDFFSGISVLNFGHSNPKVLEKAVEQLRKITHTLDFPTKARVELDKRLLDIAPGQLKNNAKIVYGGPTGSDAVEAAIKLAKYYTKRRVVIAFTNSYHGQTTTALAVTSGRGFKEPYAPLGPEVHFAPYPYTYRCPFGLDDPKECSEACLAYLEYMLENPYSGVPKPAAIIIEPIQGEGGIIIAPDDFLRGVEKLARKNDVVLIVDEIQAGLGRAGKWWSCEYSGINPDIITMAKSLGGIGLPLAGIMYRKDLDVWAPGSHAGTFRGDVVAMAAIAAALDFAKENNLLDHVNKIGNEALKYLNDLMAESKYIGEVRGRGLMIGIEFVKDKKTKEPHKEITKAIIEKCFKKGLLVWKAGPYANIIRFLPPLVISEELMNKGLEIFRDVVKEVEASM